MSSDASAQADFVQSRRAADRYGFIVPIAALGFAVLSGWMWYPGILPNDSAVQYQQALAGHYTDWSSPIMAVLWSAFEPLGIGHASLFLFHLVLYWSGIGFVGLALWRRGSRWASILVTIGGASPLFAFQNRFVGTDAGLCSALAAIFGILFWWRSQGRRVPLAAWFLLFPIAAYALLIRPNSAFAVVPLLLYAADFAKAGRPILWTALLLSLTLTAIPLAGVINREVIRASDSGAFERLPMYDLSGIADFKGDWSLVPGGRRYSSQSLSHCYTSLFWDTLMKPRCGDLWWTLPEVGSPARRQIFSQWLSAILHNPLAYAVHRLRHFNSETFFLVPPAPQCVAAPEMHLCGAPGSDLRSKILRNDYLLKNALVWPITWLVLGLGLLTAVRKSREPGLVAARALLASGLFYGFGYLFVGLATNVRYFLWTYAAVQMALLIILAANKDKITSRSSAIISLSVAAVIVLGYIFRIGNISFLL